MRVVVTRPRSSAHPRHHSTHAADARSALRTLQTRAARYARCRRAQRATHASDVIICHPERRRGTVADLRFAAILRQAQDDSGGDGAAAGTNRNLDDDRWLRRARRRMAPLRDLLTPTSISRRPSDDVARDAPCHSERSRASALSRSKGTAASLRLVAVVRLRACGASLTMTEGAFMEGERCALGISPGCWRRTFRRRGTLLR
jgi:hypothetical protein